MRKVVLLGALAFAASGGWAQANTISGQEWTFSAAQCAPGGFNCTLGTTSPGNALIAGLPLSSATFMNGATFTISNANVLDLTSGPLYTLGEFLNSTTTNVPGSTVAVAYSGTNSGATSLMNSLFYFTGQVSLTLGQVFNVEHDDGLQLTINGMTVVNAPGPTSAVNTPFTWTAADGGTGTFNFQLAYGECCGAPAVLDVALPLNVPAPIVGAGLPGLIAACGGLLALARRRRQKIA